MRPSTWGRVVFALAWTSFLCITLLVCLLLVQASANSRNKIVCREELSLTKRAELEKRLRAITGWSGLRFEDDGVLRTGSLVDGGSQAARNLLNQAVAGRKVIILEDASNRQDVVFSRVVPGRWRNHASDMPPAFVVLIDFADFDQLMGDKAALRAFNVGWGVLHEIDHVVNDSEDVTAASDAGECEEHINAMRRECNLPLRTDYFFDYFPHAQDSDFRTRFVRLAFEQADPLTKTPRRYWVMWDATLVGGLNALNAQQIAKQK